MFRLLTVVIAQLMGAAALADTIVCQPQTWFNQSNEQGISEFSFSFDFTEEEGQLTSFRPSGFNCEQFERLYFTPAEIYLTCTRSPLESMEKWGRFEVMTKIDRYTGSMSQLHHYENSEEFTIYVGYCELAEKKF